MTIANWPTGLCGWLLNLRETERTSLQQRCHGSQPESKRQRSHYQALLQLEAKINQQVQASQAEAQTLKQKLQTATGKKRQTLQAQLAETRLNSTCKGAQRHDPQHDRVVSGTGGNGLGTTICGRKSKHWPIRSVVLTAKNSDASPRMTEPALIATASKPLSGIWDLTQMCSQLLGRSTR